MRILMTADAVGGVWTYSTNLAARLETHGIETYLALMGPSPSERQRRQPRLFESNYRLEWMDHPWADVDAAGEWLLGLADALKPDIIHLNGYAHAALPFRAPKLVVAHSCVCSWWRAVHNESAPSEWDEYRRRVRLGLDAADHVVAPSHAMLAALVREHGGLKISSSVIYNGASAPKHAICSKEPFVLAAGRLRDEGKNLALLEQAAEQVSWPVFAAGDSGAVGNVIALGRLDRNDIAAWMARASIFCHPALYEPFGLAPLEAALARSALILAEIPSLREIWGDAALYIDPRNAADLAAAIDQLIGDDALRSRLADAAYRRALLYSAETQAVHYACLYRELHASTGRESALAIAWQRSMSSE
jgi:glycosyltransferase involved in cell wall biosynthesis